MTHWGQVTDLEMIYRCSCDTVLTRLAFTMGLFSPFSPFPSFLPHVPSLVFTVSLLQFQSSLVSMLDPFKTSSSDRFQISGQKKKTLLWKKSNELEHLNKIKSEAIYLLIYITYSIYDIYMTSRCADVQ